MNIFPRHLFFLFRFARLAANTFISQGVPVYLFSDITPTPFVVGFSIIAFSVHINAVKCLALLTLRKTTQTTFNFLSSTCSQCYVYLAMCSSQHPQQEKEEASWSISGREMCFCSLLLSGRFLAEDIPSFLDCCGI